MALIPIKLPAGVYGNGTDFEASNRWREANLVRWHDGSMRPIGGWTSRDMELSSVAFTFASAPRGLNSWLDNTGNSIMALGTHEKLFKLNNLNEVVDITPAGLTAGAEDAAQNLAYGGQYFGDGDYGVERPSDGTYQEATSWSLDNWGEYLIACSSMDGKIYEWSLNPSNPAAVVANAPTDNIGIVVTEERFVFALGAGGNPRKVEWSDREDNTTWTAAATNEAGGQELQTTGQIMCGIRMRGRTLLLTDNDAHIATYSGAPFVYGFERVGTSCGISSRQALVAIDEGAFWMGKKGFFIFDGSVASEIKCDVIDTIFNNLNYNQISKVCAVHNAQFGEIWWFYPSDGALENDSYVTYDYKEGHWTTGKVGRTACIDRGVFDSPIWTSATNLYNHETGYTHGADTPYAETAPISLVNGDDVMKVTSLIPDEETQGQVTVQFKTRMYPNAPETTHGSYVLTNPTSVRFTGRQIRMRIEGASSTPWKVGVMRIDVRKGGKR